MLPNESVELLALTPLLKYAVVLPNESVWLRALSCAFSEPAPVSASAAIVIAAFFIDCISSFLLT